MMHNISPVNKVLCSFENHWPVYYIACPNELTSAAAQHISAHAGLRLQPSPHLSVTAADGLHIRSPSGVMPDVCPLRYGSATAQLSLISFLFLNQVPVSHWWMLGTAICGNSHCCEHLTLTMMNMCPNERGQGCKQRGCGVFTWSLHL